MSSLTENGLLRRELLRVIDDNKKLVSVVSDRDATIVTMGAELAQLKAIVAEQKAALDKLSARDAYHNGPNSPSSSGSLSSRERAKKEADKRAKKGIKRPGRKKGHAGVTSRIRATKTIHHRPDRCNKCGHTDLHERSTTSKQTLEVVEIVLDKTNHVMHDCRCLKCGADVDATRTGTVKGTSMGPVLASVAACMWKHGSSLGSIQGLLKDVFGVDMCRAAVYRAVEAVADALAEEDEAIRQRSGDLCEPGGVDETLMGHTYRNEPLSDAPTGAEPPEAAEPWWPVASGRRGRAVPLDTPPQDPVGGCDERKQVYAWGDTTASCTVVRLAPSRGAAILHEYFGDRIGGANTTDGYAVYDRLEVQQRCFAHIIRDSEQALDLDDPAEAALHYRLLALFRRGKSLAHAGGALADPLAGQNHAMLSATAEGLAGAYREAGHAKFAGTLERAAAHLFTFILYPGLEPTNNAAERAMRSIVKQRNVRQKCATAGGRARFGILMTCFETWQKQGLSAMGKMGEILGVRPAPEYAQIRAAGSRACLTRT